MLPPFQTATKLDDISNIRHGFFGRTGGVSNGIYTSLNAGLGSNDDPDHIAQNRQLIAAAMQLKNAGQLISVPQIHSARIIEISSDIA